MGIMHGFDTTASLINSIAREKTRNSHDNCRFGRRYQHRLHHGGGHHWLDVGVRHTRQGISATVG